MKINRRNFIRNAGLAGLATAAAIKSPGAGETGFPPQHQVNADIPAPVPTSVKKAWMDLQFGMFIHFGINTYYDKEWSDGTLDPNAFNPDKLSTDQWCRTAKDAGMKYIVPVTKHFERNYPELYERSPTDGCQPLAQLRPYGQRIASPRR